MTREEIKAAWKIIYAQWVNDSKDKRELLDVYIDFVMEVQEAAVNTVKIQFKNQQ